MQSYTRVNTNPVVFGCIDIGNINDISKTFFNSLDVSDALVVENQYMWDYFCIKNRISYDKEVLSLNLSGIEDKFLNELPKETQKMFEDNRVKVLKRVGELHNLGKKVLVVSDEGSSIIADSGEFVRNYCIENGIDFKVMAGPSAVINAVSSSKIPGATSPFIFYGPIFSLEYVDGILDNMDMAPYDFLSVGFLRPKTAKAVVGRMLERFGNIEASLCIDLTTNKEKIIGKNLKETLRYLEDMGDEYYTRKENVSIVFRKTRIT